MSRTRRTYALTAAVAAIVTAANASQGAYFSQSWGWVALAFLVPTTVLLILERVIGARTAANRRSRAFMGALAVWIALSSLWSISAPASLREVERMLVYVAVALAHRARAAAWRRRRACSPASVSACSLVCGVRARDAPLSRSVRRVRRSDRLVPARRAARILERARPARDARPPRGGRGSWRTRGASSPSAGRCRGRCRCSRRRCTSRSRGARGRRSSSASSSRSASIHGGFASSGSRSSSRCRRSCASPMRPGSTRSRRRTSASRCGRHAKATGSPSSSRWQRSLPRSRRWPREPSPDAFGASPTFATRVRRRARRRCRRRPSSWLSSPSGARAAAFDKLERRFNADPVGGVDLNDRLFSVSGNGRSEQLRVAWDAGRERPLVGHGVGNVRVPVVRATTQPARRPRRPLALHGDVRRARSRRARAPRRRTSRACRRRGPRAAPAFRGDGCRRARRLGRSQRLRLALGDGRGHAHRAARRRRRARRLRAEERRAASDCERAARSSRQACC